MKLNILWFGWSLESMNTRCISANDKYFQNCILLQLSCNCGFFTQVKFASYGGIGISSFSASSWICDITMRPIFWILKSSHLPKNLVPFIYLKTSWYTEYIFHGNDPKTGQSSTFAKHDIQNISFIMYIFSGLNISQYTCIFVDNVMLSRYSHLGADLIEHRPLLSGCQV